MRNKCKENADIFLLFCSVLGILTLAAFAFDVTEADIERCAERTGWSLNRCEFELTR